MAGEQQHGIFELALAVAERALAEFTDHDRRAEGDRRASRLPHRISQRTGSGRIDMACDATRPPWFGAFRTHPTGWKLIFAFITPENMNTMYKWRTR